MVERFNDILFKLTKSLAHQQGFFCLPLNQEFVYSYHHRNLTISDYD